MSLCFVSCRPSVRWVKGAVPRTLVRNLSVHFPLVLCSRRNHSDFVVLQEPSVAKQINDFQEAFTEARTLISESHDNAGTIYFAEDVTDATEQTNLALQLWKELQQTLTDKDEVGALEVLKKEHEVKVKQLVLELDAARELLDH